jgi:hypothetical protein
VIDVPQTPRRPNPHRRVIHATCSTHGGGTGFTNLVVSKRDGVIKFRSARNGQCLLTLDEDRARTLHQALAQWLG